jgi:hypothetical protein
MLSSFNNYQKILHIIGYKLKKEKVHKEPDNYILSYKEEKVIIYKYR